MLIATEMQWERGPEQSHCFSCCGRHVKPIDVHSHAASMAGIAPPLESSCAVHTPIPTLNDFIERISVMDVAPSRDLEDGSKKHCNAPKRNVDSTFPFDSVSDDDASGCDIDDWNDRLRAHYLQKVVCYSNL